MEFLQCECAKEGIEPEHYGNGRKLEIRAYPSKNIHAKVYIKRYDDSVSGVQYGSVITGSSNFSEYGLVAQREFNVELKNRTDVDFALSQFDQLWAESVDISQDFIEAATQKTRLNDSITPYDLYLKCIYEYLEEDINLEIDLRFRGVEVDGDRIVNDKVSIALKYAGCDIPTPHLFLNEARLSAIAISVYLGMIKRHPQMKKFKILFLDDIFIGLDISNHLPLLDILDTHFDEYQVFITTYDKPWYEFVKSMLGSQWTTIEFYAQLVNEGYEIPMVVVSTDFLVKARQHYAKSDYKASAVYARSAFEKIMMEYCVKKGIKLAYKSRRKDYKAKSFWEASKSDLQPATVTKIERVTFLIYNPLSHYDPNSNPIKSELLAVIREVENLRAELVALS